MNAKRLIEEIRSLMARCTDDERTMYEELEAEAGA